MVAERRVGRRIGNSGLRMEPVTEPDSPKCGIYTPWGKRGEYTCFAAGFWRVTTVTGAGGYIASESFGTRHLSDAARRHAHRYGRYFCFSFVTDGTWAIVPYELPKFRDVLLEGDLIEMDPEEMLLRVLSELSPQYLLDAGIDPRPAEYAKWTRRQAREQAVQSKDADTIVTAKGAWSTGDPAVVEVTTADGAAHLVTRRSYEQLEPEWRRVSGCELVRQQFSTGAAEGISTATRALFLRQLAIANIRFYIDRTDGCRDLSTEQVLDYVDDPLGFISRVHGGGCDTSKPSTGAREDPRPPGRTRSTQDRGREIKPHGAARE